MPPRLALPLAVFLVVAASGAGCSSGGGSKPTPATAGYPVPAAAETALTDDAAFAALAVPLRRDLSKIAGPSNPAGREALFDLALLDSLDGEWHHAVDRLDLLAATEPDPLGRVIKGLTIRLWADALDHGGDNPEAFRAALTRAIATLPRPLVDASLAELRELAGALTPSVSVMLIAERTKGAGGRVSRQQAGEILFQRYAVRRIAPVASIIDEVIGAALPARTD